MRGTKLISTLCFATSVAALMLAVVVFAGGCATEKLTASEGQGVFQLAATKAPTGSAMDAANWDRPIEDLIASAHITVSQVTLVSNEQEEPVVVHSQTQAPIVLDLFNLEAGVEDVVIQGTVPAGDYDQLILVVDGAQVTLDQGYTFRDGSMTQDLKVPGNMIKVQLTGPISVDSEDVLALVISFDPMENFKVLGNPDSPNGINGVMFKPILRESQRSDDGEDDL